jgi:hypothetical protein
MWQGCSHSAVHPEAAHMLVQSASRRTLKAAAAEKGRQLTRASRLRRMSATSSEAAASRPNTSHTARTSASAGLPSSSCAQQAQQGQSSHRYTARMQSKHALSVMTPSTGDSSSSLSLQLAEPPARGWCSWRLVFLISRCVCPTLPCRGGKGACSCGTGEPQRRGAPGTGGTRV